MATAEVDFLHGELQKRRHRLETAMAFTPQDANLESLLREVDAALERIAAGTYGICEACHDTVERDRLLADPLVRYCLDHLSKIERSALQRDLDLASELQRSLLPPTDLKAAGWETSYHYAPLGPVSGDYCDLFPWNGHLYFMLGDVAGKGVAASMRMAQIHALFRSLIVMGLSLAEIVVRVNRFLCDSALAGQYATLVCGRAQPDGQVEIFNAGHLPVIALHQGSVRRLDSTGLPLGMFREAAFSPSCLQLGRGDLFLLYTDGLSEASGENDEYGIDRVMHLVGQRADCSAPGLISACLEDLRAFASAGPGVDDVTLLALRHGG